MSVTVAKSAGFCFGVSRAVELVEKTALSGKKTVTYGPIIHNRHVVDRFEKMGVRVIQRPEEANPGDCVVIPWRQRRGLSCTGGAECGNHRRNLPLCKKDS